MKKIKFLAVALAAFTMFSCSNDEIESLGNNAPGEQAVLTIKLKGDGDDQAQSRALGPTATTDVAINDYLVFLFREGGALDCVPYYSSSNAAANISNGTTAAKKVYVVANTGELANGPFATVKTVADLLAATGSLMDNTNNASTQTKDNLWVSGVKDVTFVGTSATVAVELKFVAAKIELVVKDNRKNMSGGAITIEDKEVVLLYAGKSGHFFGTDDEKVDQSTFYAGDVSYFPPSSIPTNITLSTALSDAVGAPFTDNTSGTVFNHFYTFGNNGDIKPTILAIKSTKTVDSGTPSTIYYPIHFTMADAGHTIVPGKYYNVVVTLNGDVAAGQGGGTTNPEVPVVTSSVQVTVTPASWGAKINVDKDFN